MVTTARGTPTGKPLENGFVTKIAIAADADIDLWEIEVTPPGIDGDEKVDQTTMWNSTWRTFAPGALATMTPISVNVAYDPECYDQILAIRNTNGWITVHFPNGDTLDFVGFLKSFIPQANTINGRPTAAMTIEPTNQLAGVETAPVHTAAL